ncbi:MAG: M20/M25/M40 family metallo-hydrolase [Acidobacteriota bacterium]|nr:M20/M25/M40 family metallo-hydrolase [Acidobacteriota bacterium]
MGQKHGNSRQNRLIVFATFLSISILSASDSFAQDASHAAALASQSLPADRMSQYSDLAQQWEQEYLRIDTTNPPGKETRAAAFFKKIFDHEGIENRVFEYAPERADIWAKIPATSKSAKPAIILLSHMDVVTSDAARWKAPPFSANIIDGAIYGRGAQDMKSDGLADLVTLVMLKREKTRLDRDVIFLAVSDEEVNGAGSDWFIANQRSLLENAEFLINEGGGNLLGDDGKLKFVGIGCGEKSPFWLHIVAHGRPGHGSKPNQDSAPNRLVRALDKIIAYRTPFRVLPVVDEFLRTMAPYQAADRAKKYQNIQLALEDKNFQTEVERDETLNYLLRDTISLSMLGGSQQTNVIPPDAWANIDVRLLPGSDPKVFLETMERLVNDPNVSIEPLNPHFRSPNSSPTNTTLYEAFKKVSAEYFPGAPVAPRMESGYTESQRFRPLGINSYGFSPYATTEAESATEHGNDERIRVEEVRRGFRVMYDVVNQVAAAP